MRSRTRALPFLAAVLVALGRIPAVLAGLLLFSLRAAAGTVAEVCAPRPPGGACWSDFADAPVDGFEIGRDGNIYAAYALDALQPGCAAAAARRLEQRLRDTLDLYGGTANGPGPRVKDPRSGKPVHPFTSWLAGTAVTHVFNAAVELRRAGVAVDDGLLQKAEAVYAAIPVPQDPGCGLRSLPWANSCMDDFALTASGHAWIAAYEVAVGRDGGPWAQRARKYVAEALSPMSDHGGGPCFFALETLEDGTHRVKCDEPGATATVMGVDHGRENPGYGLGLMTSVASACAALFFAGARCEFTEDESAVARELFRHAQSKASPDGASFAAAGPGGCVDFADPDGARLSCADEDTLVWSGGGYRPSDFPVSFFYAKRGVTGMDPAPAFAFDHYCEPRTGTGPGDFWGPNRRAFYERLAWRIFE